MSVEFRNSVFRGCLLDVSAFGLVRVVAEPSAPRGSNVITDEIALFESSVIVDRNQPPDPGVIDLGQPRDEVVFRGVGFASVHLRGWTRPEWFEDCWFRNRVLPESLDRAALEAGGNRLEDVLWADQALD